MAPGCAGTQRVEEWWETRYRVEISPPHTRPSEAEEEIRLRLSQMAQRIIDRYPLLGEKAERIRQTAMRMAEEMMQKLREIGGKG